MRIKKSDSRVKVAIVHDTAEWEALVICRLEGRVQGFQLVVEKEGVVLRGRAATYYAKQLAQHIVMETNSLPILANEIEVVRGGDS